MNNAALMREIEDGYRQASGLANRSMYKIFYTSIHPAPVLALGINPAGNPENILPDGQRDRIIPGKRHAASESFYENNENDLIDCHWRENNIVTLLQDVLSRDREGLRGRVVKTNLAFRRAGRGQIKKLHRMSMAAAMGEAKPFLARIISRVQPKVVILGGVKLEDFTCRFGRRVRIIASPERDPKVKQVVFCAGVVELPDGAEVPVIQVAHASQFSWTYRRYQIAQRIRSLVSL
jgi:hypothetical protein